MVSFSELWARRAAAARQLLGLDRQLATEVDEEEQAEFDDIFGLPLKRLSFDDSEGTSNQSTSAPEAMPASCMGPSVANQRLWGSARLRECARGCACTCDRCAYLRSRAWHARWGADPT
jgi:hypothetical protein